jgi:hypothetical protein
MEVKSPKHAVGTPIVIYKILIFVKELQTFFQSKDSIMEVGLLTKMKEYIQSGGQPPVSSISLSDISNLKENSQNTLNIHQRRNKDNIMHRK